MLPTANTSAAYRYDQVMFNDHVNISVTVSCTQTHRFFLLKIIIVHDSRFPNSSYGLCIRGYMLESKET